MAYTPQTWADGASGTAITAARLNYMETGISNAHALQGYPLGLAGATVATRFVGATSGGPPVSGTFLTGDYVVDTSNSVILVCSVGGSPGTWTTVNNDYVVCTSGTRPGSPYKGLTIYETDTGKTLVYYGGTSGWWKPWHDAWGFYGEHQIATDVGTTSSSYVDTGLYVDVTPSLANRKYEIAVNCMAYTDAASTTTPRIAIRKGSTLVVCEDVAVARDVAATGVTLVGITDLGAGTTRLKVSLLRSTGAGSVHFYSDSNRYAKMYVKDIGPATGSNPPAS